MRAGRRRRRGGRERLEDDGVRFIHVEVYEDNDPAKGYNRWMTEWGLTTEPWTSWSDERDDRGSLRGGVSVHELEQVVHEKLAGR